MFPPEIMHGFDKYKGKKNRYSLIFNTKGIDQFALQQKMRILNERKKS